MGYMGHKEGSKMVGLMVFTLMMNRWKMLAMLEFLGKDTLFFSRLMMSNFCFMF